MSNPSNDPAALIGYALANAPRTINFVPFVPLVARVQYGSRRQKVKSPIEEAPPTLETRRFATITVEAPEYVGQNIQGPKEDMDVYLLVRVSRETVERMDSPIIQPGVIA